MSIVASHVESTVVRQVFPHWSITIPAAFAETFVHEDGYWHAWDDRRSVSLTSLVIADHRKRPVPAGMILERFPPGPGSRVTMPTGFDGWAGDLRAHRGRRGSADRFADVDS